MPQHDSSCADTGVVLDPSLPHILQPPSPGSPTRWGGCCSMWTGHGGAGQSGCGTALSPRMRHLGGVLVLGPGPEHTPWMSCGFMGSGPEPDPARAEYWGAMSASGGGLGPRLVGPPEGSLGNWGSGSSLQTDQKALGWVDEGVRGENRTREVPAAPSSPCPVPVPDSP